MHDSASSGALLRFVTVSSRALAPPRLGSALDQGRTFSPVPGATPNKRLLLSGVTMWARASR